MENPLSDTNDWISFRLPEHYDDDRIHDIVNKVIEESDLDKNNVTVVIESDPITGALLITVVKERPDEGVMHKNIFDDS